jgi:hypothetical protein
MQNRFIPHATILQYTYSLLIQSTKQEKTCLRSFDTTRTAEKTRPPVILLCRGNMFTDLLPSNGKGIHRQTHTFSFDMNVTHRNHRVQLFYSSIFACIRCRGNVYTKRLPSNVCGYTPMRGIYEVRHRDGLRCHDIHIEFHKERFNKQVVLGMIHRHTDSKVFS